MQPLENRRLLAATLDIIGGVLVYNGSAVANNLTVSVTSPSGAGNYFFNDTGETITVGATAIGLGAVGTGTNTVQVPDGAVNSMLINTDGGNDVINLSSTTDDISVDSAVGVPDTLNVGVAGNVDGLLADLFFQDSGGVGNMVINDSNNPNPKTINITSIQTSGLLPSGFTLNYGPGVTDITGNFGFGGNTITGNLPVDDSLGLLNINSGDASDIVNLVAVNAGLTVNVNMEIGGADATTIGNAGSTAAILGVVTVQDSGGVSTLTVDDSATATARIVSLTNGSITGMTANPIIYQPGVTTLNVKTGSSADAVSINLSVNDDLGLLNLDTGGAADTVAVLNVNAGLQANIQTGAGAGDKVNIGSATGNGTGTTANISGTVGLLDSAGGAVVVLDAGGEVVASTFAIGGGQITSSGFSGLITYGSAGGITDVTVLGGSAADTFNVTPEATVLLHIDGNDPVNPTLSGDRLNLVLTGVTDPSVVRTGDDGVITFGNRATIDYLSIESVLNGIFTFSTSSYVVNENGGGVIVTVQRVGGSSGTASVSFSQSGGTASSPGDYDDQPLTLDFADGETFKNIFIPITNDNIDEPNETFNLVLSNAVNALLDSTPSVVTIIDNDPTPGISVNNVSVSEGNSGTKLMAFTVSLSNPSSQTITVQYNTQNNTASSSSDYVEKIGDVTFLPGQTSKQVNITIKGDTTVESNETFFLKLHTPTNATIADDSGTGTINNDDSSGPSLAINDVSILEGSSGTKTMTFTVTRSGSTSGQSTVNYATANGTASSGSDYISKTGSLTFLAGQTSKTITITINGDNTNEPDETFFVNLTGAVGASISDSQGKGTILDD